MLARVRKTTGALAPFNYLGFYTNATTMDEPDASLSNKLERFNLKAQIIALSGQFARATNQTCQ
jgi:hypothetical protein